MKKILLSLLLVCESLATLHAQTPPPRAYYMTVAGSGALNGDNWANALPCPASANITTVLNTTMKPGDTLYLGGKETATSPDYGTRMIVITTSGTSALRKQIIGVDRGHGLPTFSGITSGTRTNNSIHLIGNATDGGCSYWTIKDLVLERRERGIGTKEAYRHQGLIIEGVTARRMADYCFYFHNCDDLLVQDCRSYTYNEVGFYLHYDCHNAIFRDCEADCFNGIAEGITDPEQRDAAIAAWRALTSSPIGFDLHEKNLAQPDNTNILYEDCVSRNNLGNKPSDYPQGDGFMVQQQNIGVIFRRCKADGARDGGYDLKGPNIVMNECVAINAERYGFKIWYNSTLNNCIGFNNAAQLYLAGEGSNTITANHCTFHCPVSTQRGVEVEHVANTAVLNDCIISYSGAVGPYYKGNSTGYIPPVLNNTERLANTSNTANSPRYQNPTAAWDGVGTNYDNLTYGTTKGYNSTVATQSSIIGVNLADTATNVLAPSETVGAIPAANWNNTTTNNQTLSTILDNEANVTGATVSFSTTTYGYTNSTGTLPDPMADDAKMMRSTRAGSSSSSITATVTQNPYSSYEVYVYWGGRTTGEAVPATMTVELQLQDASGVWITQETKYIKDDNRLWDATYNESTATSAAAATDGNEYVVFRSLSSPSFRIRSTCGVRTGFSGFQIVAH